MSDSIFGALTRIAISSGISDLADPRLETLFWKRFGNAELKSQRATCKELGVKANARDAMVDKMYDSFIGWVSDYFRARAVYQTANRNLVDDERIGPSVIAESFDIKFSSDPSRSMKNLLEKHGFDSSCIGKLTEKPLVGTFVCHSKVDTSDEVEKPSEMEIT